VLESARTVATKTPADTLRWQTADKQRSH